MRSPRVHGPVRIVFTIVFFVSGLLWLLLLIALVTPHKHRKDTPVIRDSVIPAEQWKWFSSKDGGFSARFPGDPKMTNMVIDIERERTKEFYFRTWTGDADYTVAYCDYPESVQRLKPEQQLDECETRLIKKYGKEIDRKELQVGGFPARELEFSTIRKVSLTGKIRLILANHRLYEITVIFLTQNPHPSDFNVFFSSFSLLNPPT